AFPGTPERLCRTRDCRVSSRFFSAFFVPRPRPLATLSRPLLETRPPISLRHPEAGRRRRTRPPCGTETNERRRSLGIPAVSAADPPRVSRDAPVQGPPVAE